MNSIQKTFLSAGLILGTTVAMGAELPVVANNAAEKVCSFRGTSFRGDTRRHCWSLSTYRRSSTWTKRIRVCGLTLYTGSVHNWKDELRSGLKLALVKGRCGLSIGARRCNVVCRFKVR